MNKYFGPKRCLSPLVRSLDHIGNSNKPTDNDTMTKLSAIDGHVIYLYCQSQRSNAPLQ